jgi:dolichol-phosphate mannosyltransferase
LKKASSNPTYTIILPVYNESANLPIIIHLIHQTFLKDHAGGVDDVRVIVVEDNSPDGTRTIAHQLRSSYGDDFIHVLERAGKLGLGSAYLDALKLIDSTYVILMDADLSHHPKFIPAFIEKMKRENLDVVTGTRYADGGGVAGWDFKRKLMSKGANFIADFLLNPGVSDLTGSFRLYKRSVLEEIFPKIVSKGYVFQMEVMVRIITAGYSVGEVGISFVDRIYGESKLGAGEVVGYLKGLGWLFFTM